jgi:hypothetical protein
MLESIASVVADKALGSIFERLSKGIKRSFRYLAERAGAEFAESYTSVSDFWYRGIDAGLSESSAKVEIQGSITLYTPLVPGHPRSRPGRSVQTWVKNRGQSLDFTTESFVTWGDGVISLPEANNSKAIIGMYDQYGLAGLAAVPLILDLSNKQQNETYSKLKLGHPRSLSARVTGRLVDFPYSVTEDFGILPIGELMQGSIKLPNYVVEVFNIEITGDNPVLYAAQWIGMGDDGLFPIYCNIVDGVHSQEAAAQLISSMSLSKGNVEAVFDPMRLGLGGTKLPILNQYLREVFRKT